MGYYCSSFSAASRSGLYCQAHRGNTHECENKITVEQEEQTSDFACTLQLLRKFQHA